MENTNENNMYVINICKNILKLVNNTTTKIKIEENDKNSYYVFLNDTIYLSNRQTSKDRKDSRLVLICHECIHSVQSKVLQWINFILANLELVLFVIAIILKYIFKQEGIVISYIVINILSIIVRTILEADASLRSIQIVKKHLDSAKNNENEKEKEQIDIKKIKRKMLLTLPAFVFFLFGFKVMRLIIITL